MDWDELEDKAKGATGRMTIILSARHVLAGGEAPVSLDIPLAVRRRVMMDETRIGERSG